MKKIFCVQLCLVLCGYTYSTNTEQYEKKIDIQKYNNLSLKDLLQIGNKYFDKNIYDSAYICFSLINNKSIAITDTPSMKIICESLNKASTINFHHGDYKAVLEYLLRALKICEEIRYDKYIARIYVNIGNVHYQFDNFDLAKKYYNLAYDNSKIPSVSGASLNNLGLIAHNENKIDSALKLFRKAYVLQGSLEDPINNSILNNIALVYQTRKMYDSAFHYYKTALNIAIKLNQEDKEAKMLSNIGQLYIDVKNYDSASHYIYKSNLIVDKSNLMSILSLNYLYLSEIEELKGNKSLSFNYYKRYSAIKDSLFNAKKYRTISDLQFMYDMAKIDQQIKGLNIEQKINERTTLIQKRLLFATVFVLIVVINLLLLLFFKNKTLNKAYNVLVNKNKEIILSEQQKYHLQLDYEQQLKEKNLIIHKISKKNEIIAEIKNEKLISFSVKHKHKLELAILEIMNDSSVFCKSDFSIAQLSEMVHSNPTYISWIINNSFNKNFNAFINEYRIKEACRMLSDFQYKKYSIETIATMVGFKSKGSFNPIFKEITGVTPSFYAKSLNL